MEFTNVKGRIEKILQSERVSASQFADEIGVQRPNVSHILSGRNNPSLEFVQKVLAKYKSINADWLLFGNGDMYKDRQTSLFTENEFNNSTVSDEKHSFTTSLMNNPLPAETESVDIGANKTVNVVKSSESLSAPLTDQIPKSNQHENMRSEKASEAHELSNLPSFSRSEKKVKQIIVLYTDNTFSIYNSE